MLVVNIWGGSGTCKSALLHLVVGTAKLDGIRVEGCINHARDIALDRDWKRFQDQEAILDEQYRLLARLKGQVDFAVTDSPLLGCLHHCVGDVRERLAPKARTLWNRFDNASIRIERQPERLPGNRIQDDRGTPVSDTAVTELLVAEKIPFTSSRSSAALEVVLAWMGLEAVRHPFVD